MNRKGFRPLISVLLVITGILHIAVALFGPNPELAIPLSIFGVSYLLLGIWVRSGGRLSLLVTLIITALGLGIGGNQYISNGGDIPLLIMLAIDVVVLVLGGLQLRREQPSIIDRS